MTRERKILILAQVATVVSAVVVVVALVLLVLDIARQIAEK